CGTRGGPRGDGRLDELGGAGVDDVAHLGVGVAPVLLEATTAHRGHLRQGGADLLDPLAARCERYEVRLGEVPVVLGVGLHPARRRRACVLVPVPGLLDDGASRVEDPRLAGDLVAYGPLDRAEAVDVLRLRPRA